MKKIKILLILASFFSLFLFEKINAIGPKTVSNIFEYLDYKKEKFKYSQLIPKVETLKQPKHYQVLIKYLTEFLESSLSEETSDEAFNLKDIYFYSSTYEKCLNKLFPFLNKEKILKYKTKYLTSLFIINKYALYNTYFNLYEKLKNDLFSKVNSFLEDRTNKNFLEMKKSFKEYNDIFITEINSYDSIKCIKDNFEFIKKYYYDINHILFPVDKIIINILIPQFLKIAYIYYLTYNFVLNNLNLKEQEIFRENSIIPYSQFFTDKFIKEKNLKEISNSLKKLYSIEEIATNIARNSHHIFF